MPNMSHEVMNTVSASKAIKADGKVFWYGDTIAVECAG
jgi:hypothetical protein